MKTATLGVSIAALSLFATPILADSGHVIQVHHGHDCIEFTTFEEAAKICGANNVYGQNGAVNATCLKAAHWFAVSDNDQLSFYIAAVQAIDTAYGEWQGVNAYLDQRQGEGYGDDAKETDWPLASSSALGFTTDGTVVCGNIDGAYGQKETVYHVGNLNLPPAGSN
jgi:hypothetical protein